MEVVREKSESQSYGPFAKRDCVTQAIGQGSLRTCVYEQACGVVFGRRVIVRGEKPGREIVLAG